jgi:hypothetical protein
VHNNTLPRRVAFVLAFVAAPLARAEGFCSQLNTVLAAAPQFVSLRGASEGMQYDGTLLVLKATQCKVRNKSYECLWEDMQPEALPMLQGFVRKCLGSRATFREGSPLGRKFSNFTGGVFAIDDTSIIVDFNKDTDQLWLTVLPPGVSQ